MFILSVCSDLERQATTLNKIFVTHVYCPRFFLTVLAGAGSAACAFGVVRPERNSLYFKTRSDTKWGASCGVWVAGPDGARQMDCTTRRSSAPSRVSSQRQHTGIAVAIQSRRDTANRRVEPIQAVAMECASCGSVWSSGIQLGSVPGIEVYCTPCRGSASNSIDLCFFAFLIPIVLRAEAISASVNSTASSSDRASSIGLCSSASRCSSASAALLISSNFACAFWAAWSSFSAAPAILRPGGASRYAPATPAARHPFRAHALRGPSLLRDLPFSTRSMPVTRVRCCQSHYSTVDVWSRSRRSPNRTKRA
jgi:hypothetical protein